jgi:hypothetical protein
MGNNKRAKKLGIIFVDSVERGDILTTKKGSLKMYFLES